jgi:hypothetical protein
MQPRKQRKLASPLNVPTEGNQALPARIERKSEVKSAGWTIRTTISEDQDSVLDQNVPEFSSLRVDPSLKVMRRSAVADYYRLLALPAFWKAAATGEQSEIDQVARRLVPAIPAWSLKTWKAVSKLDPDKLKAVAQWIAGNCSRVPVAPLNDRLSELPTLINAWINFDQNAKWFEPDLARSKELKRFIKDAATFVDLEQPKQLSDHTTKRIPRLGAPQTVARTIQIMEGAHIWNLKDQPSIKDLHDALVNRFNWKRVKQKTSDSLQALTRDAIRLAKAKRFLE